MGVGSRMMTQLVSDLIDQCGPKAVEAFKIVVVVSDATESMILKAGASNRPLLSST